MVDPIGVSKITRNFQVSIPPDVRKQLDIKEGNFIAFFNQDGDIIVKKIEG